MRVLRKDMKGPDVRKWQYFLIGQGFLTGKADGLFSKFGNWTKQNIVTVNIPQLKGIKGAPTSSNIQFHRLAAQQVQAMFGAWEGAGLLDRILSCLSWGGSYVPRLVRGGASLSNHAFGTAFDINVSCNRLGVQPALAGEEGSVRKLVPIANEHGFFWGGHYAKRTDGMHFEVAVLKAT
jgi:hypothetical protein